MYAYMYIGRGVRGSHGGSWISEVQLAWASGTSEGATHPVELHPRRRQWRRRGCEWHLAHLRVAPPRGASGPSRGCESHILGSEWSVPCNHSHLSSWRVAPLRLASRASPRPSVASVGGLQWQPATSRYCGAYANISGRGEAIGSRGRLLRQRRARSTGGCGRASSARRESVCRSTSGHEARGGRGSAIGRAAG